MQWIISSRRQVPENFLLTLHPTCHFNLVQSSSVIHMATPAWSAATKDEQKHAKLFFRIPKNAKRILFPNRRDSIWEMLQFELPPITSSYSESPKYTEFFSDQLPSIPTPDFLQKLRKLPLPNATAIQQLNTLSREHWMNGAESVRYIYLTGEETLFPLWVVLFWTVVLTTYY